jgi:signal transduction histidine kinase
MFFVRLKPALRRLSVRLTLWHSLLFMSSALVLLVLTYFLLRNRARATEHYVIESRTNQYVSEYNRAGLDGVRHLATLRRGRAQQAFFVRVGDAQNRTVFLRHAEDWAEFRPEELEDQPLPEPGARTWKARPSADGTQLMYASERLPDGGVLQVGKSNEELIELLADYRRSSLLVLLIFVPASFAGGAFVTSRMLRPVQHLTRVTREIVETNRLDARVPSAGSGDELDALVQIFNKMIGRIEALVCGMRDSIDNVAHDLRTPLTRLRHKAQAIIELDHQAAPEPRCAGYRAAVDALADCVEEADRVSTILDTLMDIAEAEAGLAKLEIASLPLAALIADAADAYDEFAQERGITIIREIPDEIRVNGDSTGLFRAFANLIDNAIKYTPRGGTVRLAAEQTGQVVEVQVEDTGIGISPGDLPRIWERLFRGDRSRSERGLGLGLSFVRAIVETHGGTVAVESQPGAGTCVRLTLPAATRVSASGERSLVDQRG